MLELVDLRVSAAAQVHRPARTGQSVDLWVRCLQFVELHYHKSQDGGQAMALTRSWFDGLGSIAAALCATGSCVALPPQRLPLPRLHPVVDPGSRTRSGMAGVTLHLALLGAMPGRCVGQCHAPDLRRASAVPLQTTHVSKN